MNCGYVKGNNESLQLMQDDVPPMKYMDLLAESVESISNNEQIISSRIIASFYETMNDQDNQFTAYQNFDDSIEQSACFLLRTLQFSQLQRGTDDNSKRVGLFKVVDCLYVEGMISREGRHTFSEQYKQGVMDKISKFLEYNHLNHSTSKQALIDRWNKNFCYSSEQLWQFLQKEEASLKDYPFLFRLAQLSIELSIHHIRSHYFIRFIQEGQLFFNIPEVISESKQEEISQLLIKISKQKALFIGQQYETLIPLLKQLPPRLSKVLSIEDISLLDLAGPILDRSLLGERIQLSLRYSGVSQTFLTYIKSAYEMGRANWLKQWQLGEDNKLLMLTVDKVSFEKIFNIPNMKMLIIYFDYQKGQDCVQAIARYARQNEILIFCILIKSWWKQIENTKSFSKIKLSSHALMLMAIFYLKESSQVLPIKYSSGQLSISSRNLFSQFVGFLQYYGPNGKFDKTRSRIGIYEDSLMADANFMINLKGCRCGETKVWLSRGYPDVIDQIFQKSRAEIVSCNPQRIYNLFCKK